MRILLVFFSNPNAGDYLIEKRTINLFKSFFHYGDIDILSGIKQSIENIDINLYDMIVFGGGPFYDDRVMESMVIPFLGKILNKTRFHMVGSGIYGNDCSDNCLYSRSFSNNTLEFYKMIEKKNGTFGCRDEISYSIMKNAGLKNVYMTGCPAWYDLDYLENLKLKCFSKPRRIIISNPGVTKVQEEQEIRANQAIEVVRFIADFFGGVEIAFTFNAGIETKYSKICNLLIKDYLDSKKIPYVDMINDHEGFEYYDSFDLHIGFRVHSHIYCLSHGIPSILIEEDVRGYGMNETLGLPHLLSFDSSKMNMDLEYSPNRFLLDHMKNRLEYEMETAFFRYNGALRIIQNTYSNGWIKWMRLIERG